ncbi:MAG: DNA (cytosine-5-)-methyltransferase [Nitrospira sp. WS110]|nr:DNA (cytosine-5-)-methyltransferase [Nitrospira sp. WS110]
MKVGSLFSGIGGFDLGLERAGFEISWQVEIDDYCRRVLRKHWPNVRRYEDIRGIDWSTVEPIDLLCGGFPCQDLSFAGKRAGIDGERSGLWSEFVRAIRALRPRYVIVENVPGLLTNPYMGRVLGDLAACGYDAEWDCLSAQVFGLPHRRTRVWIVAYPKQNRSGFLLFSSSHHFQSCSRSVQATSCAADISAWNREEVCPPKSIRVVDGIPNELDACRFGQLGNAIVPQIAEALGRMILEADHAGRG